jgi:polysaccharide biosynthesis/export protein
MDNARFLAQASLFAIALACAGCALPAAAPTAINVEAPPTAEDDDYFIVPLAPYLVQVMGERHEPGFPASFHLASYKPNIELRPGDIIGITVYETGGPTVFGDRLLYQSQKHAGVEPAVVPAKISTDSPGHVDTMSTGAIPPNTSPNATAPTTTTLPPMTVEDDGNVLIPYAGRIAVSGLTPSKAAERIKEALSSETLRPQVLVTLVANPISIATVGGDANRPTPVSLTLRGERLLDVIGQAGGSKWPAPDTTIDIVRGRNTARVKLQTIVDYPKENIVVRPSDQIFLTHDPRTFTVLGASQKVSQYTFDVPKVSVAEAIGRAGGAIDTIGNPAAVYLFREEPTAIALHVLELAALLPPPDAPNNSLAPFDPLKVKLVYKIDMNTAEGYFLAKKIMMRDKDLLLIANAEGTQLLKFFTLARGVTGMASDLNFFTPGGPLGNNVSAVVR